jgi:hypothetical protein
MVIRLQVLSARKREVAAARHVGRPDMRIGDADAGAARTRHRRS